MTTQELEAENIAAKELIAELVAELIAADAVGGDNE